MRPCMVLLNTLPVRLRSAIPLPFLQSDESPFLGNLTIKPVFKSSGIFSEIQISSKIFSRMVWVRDSSAFSSSGQMLSAPGALICHFSSL